MYILGIESSCDEMAMALYHRQEHRIVAHHLFSQIALHKAYGGVVPEIASRSHMLKLHPVFMTVLEKAGIGIDDISAVAVTSKPGLAGSLLIGFCFAKGFAWARGIPLISVNHLEGHIFSSFLDADGQRRSDIPFPHLALSVSGGHCALYKVLGFGHYEEIGNTRDDAAGEAFDKIAKLMRLGYPGGPIIEELAAQENFVDFFHYPRTKHTPGDFSFSFSGLKTAVLYDLVKRGHFDLATNQPTKTLTPEIQRRVASSLLVCVGDIFVKLLKRAHEAHPECTAITFVGGVACNSYLRNRIETLCKEKGLRFTAAPRQFCTDNGSMIALVGANQLDRNIVSHLQSDIFE